MTQEEATKLAWEMGANPYSIGGMTQALMKGAEIGVTEQKAKDKELIDMLIQELYASRFSHLGITALDSAYEREKKEREGNTALIRGIDRTIKYVKEMMEE